MKEGLTPEEILTSRAKHGTNVLTPPPRIPWWIQYKEKFNDPVIRILIIAACLALGAGTIHGEYVEGIGIIIAIFLSTFMAFLNEFKAGKEFDILNKTDDDIPVKVRRNGEFTTIPKRDIVVGDVVWIELGDEIPADGQLLEAVSLQVDESRLTGETEPADKHLITATTQTSQSAYLSDKLYRSTNAVDGHGLMEVTAVGDLTEIGKTARQAAEEPEIETPLQQQLNKLSKYIGIAAFFAATLIFITLTGRGFLVGELYLTLQQSIFTAIIIVTILLGLSQTWLPIAKDLKQLITKKAAPEQDNPPTWFKTLLLALGFFAVSMGLAWSLNLLPRAPEPLLPTDVGVELLRYFMVAVTIIVASIPEGLPMSVTLSLAYSMRKMTASNNLVRHMHACETIGAATVICTDKTGTLTTNEMRVFATEFPSLTNNSPAPLIYEAIAANTTANLSKAEDQTIRAIGNPTECALLIWLESQGANYADYRQKFTISKQWTFSTERKFMATMGLSPAKQTQVLHLKGAPEIILEHCQNILTNQGLEAIGSSKQRIQETVKSYQARGMRTLAFAYKETSETADTEIEELAHGLTWLGFVAIIDPIRKEVPGAIKACRDAGIEVKIVTGDNQETAMEIARQIGLWEDNNTSQKHLTGKEFENLSDAQLRPIIHSLRILSRARPAHKLRLVKILQEEGQVVAVTGDGTNDAPALNYADVGLSMGRAGTAVAKEASDIILLDDSFNSIANAVIWGRSIYENIQRFILFQLTINVAALGIALIGPFIGIKLPLTVTQILWINLIMDTFAALALASEPPHADVMKKKPRNPQDFIISKHMAKNIICTAGLFLLILLSFLVYIQRDGHVTEHELSIFFTGFVMLQVWNLFNARALGWKQSAFTNINHNRSFVFITSIIFLGQILLVQYGRSFFRTVPLSFTEWLAIIGATSVVLWIGEILRFGKRLACNTKLQSNR